MPGILLTFEQKVANASAFNDFIEDGKEFAHYVELIDDMCDEIGIPTLSSFCSDVGEVPDELWFNTNDGLRTVDGLIKELANQMKTITSKRKRAIFEILIATMKALRQDLKLASQRKSRFALLYC